MAFYSEEWLWNFVESVVSYMNDSRQLISVTRVKLCNSVNQHLKSVQVYKQIRYHGDEYAKWYSFMLLCDDVNNKG